MTHDEFINLFIPVNIYLGWAVTKERIKALHLEFQRYELEDLDSALIRAKTFMSRFDTIKFRELLNEAQGRRLAQESEKRKEYFGEGPESFNELRPTPEVMELARKCWALIDEFSCGNMTRREYAEKLRELNRSLAADYVLWCERLGMNLDERPTFYRGQINSSFS
jgi:hypothetical protein